MWLISCSSSGCLPRSYSAVTCASQCGYGRMAVSRTRATHPQVRTCATWATRQYFALVGLRTLARIHYCAVDMSYVHRCRPQIIVSNCDDIDMQQCEMSPINHHSDNDTHVPTKGECGYASTVHLMCSSAASFGIGHQCCSRGGHTACGSAAVGNGRAQ
jgi:hypothetical protein